MERINRRDLEGLVELMPPDQPTIDLAGDVEEGRDSMRHDWAVCFFSFPECMIHV